MMSTTLASEPFDFEVPSSLVPAEPPEARGLERDDVRMLVARRSTGSVEHERFRDIGGRLSPGDLLVVNTSRTIPAAIEANRASGEGIRLHLSTRLPGNLWIVELRKPERGSSRPFASVDLPERLRLPAGASADVLAPYLSAGRMGRLFVATVTTPVPLYEYLEAHAGPIRYADGPAVPIDHYQTIFATEPGSVEMPSAARPFSDRVVTALVRRGIGLAPVLLHAGVSSLDAGEPPLDEYFSISEDSARRINEARAAGGRIVAVGTTVVRALETVADRWGNAHPGRGWTNLVVTPQRGVRLVDGLLTGWHEAKASHLLLVEAVAGPELMKRSYTAAIAERYLWHEFGDLHLVVP